MKKGTLAELVVVEVADLATITLIRSSSIVSLF
jgi:hypothetical protein